MYMLRITLVLGLCFSCIACIAQMQPIDGFTTFVDPEEVGVSEKALKEALSYLKSQSFEDGIGEVVMLRNGLVFYQGDSVHKQHNIYSCTKGFTSTILGLLVKENRLKMEAPVADVLPELKKDYPKLRWKHFATMTSGYSAKGRSRWDDENSDWSWTPYDPEAPHFEPGTRFEYWDEAQMMYGKALTVILGGTLYDYLDRKIMKPIGIHSWSWGTEQETESGIPINNGCTGIVVNACQLARFGLLYLRQGQYKNNQLLPKNFVAQATMAQVSATLPVFDGDRKNIRGSGSYGYNWWVNASNGLSAMPDAPPGAYYLSGLNHNILMVIPEWDMVIVRMGDDKNPVLPKHVVWNDFLEKLGQGMRK